MNFWLSIILFPHQFMITTLSFLVPSDTIKVLAVGGREPSWVQPLIAVVSAIVGAFLTYLAANRTLTKQFKAQHDLELEKITEQTRAEYAVAIFQARLEAYGKLRDLLKLLFHTRRNDPKQNFHRFAYDKYRTLKDLTIRLIEEGWQIEFLFSEGVHQALNKIRHRIIDDARSLSQWADNAGIEESNRDNSHPLDEQTQELGRKSNEEIGGLIKELDRTIKGDLELFPSICLKKS